MLVSFPVLDPKAMEDAMPRLVRQKAAFKGHSVLVVSFTEYRRRIEYEADGMRSALGCPVAVGLVGWPPATVVFRENLLFSRVAMTAPSSGQAAVLWVPPEQKVPESGPWVSEVESMWSKCGKDVMFSHSSTFQFPIRGKPREFPCPEGALVFPADFGTRYRSMFPGPTDVFWRRQYSWILLRSSVRNPALGMFSR